jgi:ABC-2 type transport system permease protein
MIRELRLLWQDSWGRWLALWLPLMLLGCLWWIFSGALVRELPIGLVDLDHSALSRQLARDLDASPSLHLSADYASVEEGSRALRGGEIYALVVMPLHLERDARLGTAPRITAWSNSQFVLIAKVVNAALAQVVGTLNGQVGVLAALAQGKALPGAMGQALPLTSQVTALYNLNSSYAQFMLGALFPAVWQILLTLYGLNALSREDRLQLPWCQGGVWRPLLRKFALHTLIGWGWGVAWSLALFHLLGYPQQGNPLWLALGLALASGGCVAIGMVYYAALRDAARAISLAGSLTAPGLAFMGITFPTMAMEPFARFWRALLPLSHYADLQVAVANHGMGLATIWPQLAMMSAFWLLLLLVKRRYDQEAAC